MDIFTTKISAKLRELFSEAHLEELSRKTGFMSYKSKLRPHMFVDFLLFRNHDDTQCSLNDFVTALKLRFGIGIKKQSIDERFNENAVAFIKGLVSEQLRGQIITEVKGQSFFKSIKIKDSTRFQISGHLEDFYPGPKGGASGAGIHIQFEYDFLNGTISDLTVTNAKRQDTTDAKETVGDIEKKDLIIRDLGYFDQSVFVEIIEREAYFISRFKPKTNLYDLAGQKIDLKKIRLWMDEHGLTRTELMVTTNEIKTPIRLLIERLPKEVIDQRIAKASKEARKKGRELTKEYKDYASLGLFITNVPEEVLSTKSVAELYHVRWQIELRFKCWKSYCKLHKVKKMKRYRFECQLYANLLYILITWEMSYNFQQIGQRYLKKHMSINKLYKTLINYFAEFRSSLVKSMNHLEIYISKMYEVSRINLLLEPKKKKVSLISINALCVGLQLVK